MKLKENFDFAEGPHMPKAISIQCSTFYRHWRKRLNSKCLATLYHEHRKWLVYNWGSLKQTERSEKNRSIALSIKTHLAFGAKSIVMIV